MSYFVRLSPGQRRLRRVTHTPGLFHLLAWLDSSVPGTRGHLRWLLFPEFDDRAKPQRRPPGDPSAGVREPRRPGPPSGIGSMSIDPETGEAR